MGPRDPHASGRYLAEALLEGMPAEGVHGVIGVGGFDFGNLHSQLFALSDATTWAESRRIIDGYPELVTVNTDALLFGLIGQAERLGDTAAAASFKQVSRLLQRCRDVGVETAFAEMARADVKRAANAEQLIARLAKGT